MEQLLTIDALVSLLTLTLMELVLGIDNIVFLAILVGKLPKEQQGRARVIGLSLAIVLRLGMLLGLQWILKLDRPLFTLLRHGFSGKDLILLGGGAFLVFKATHEIYHKLEVTYEEQKSAVASNFALAVAQIVVLDLVFSLDSVITAVGMAQQIPVMAAAMVIAVAAMLVFSGAITGFVNRHPSVKILALSFLLLIGVMLGAEGLGQHISKGYIYSAMAFSLLVELLNMRFRKKHAPVPLHEPDEETRKLNPVS